jgi:hypothetical protein
MRTFKKYREVNEEWATESPIVGTDWSFLPEEVVQTLIPNFMTNTPPVGNLTVENKDEIAECIRECESLQESNADFILLAAKEPYRIFSDFLHSKGEDPQLDKIRDMWNNKKHVKAIEFMKDSIRRSRPYWIDDRVSVIPGAEADSYAFPSGHACINQFIALTLGDQFPKWKRDFLQIADRIAQSRIQAGVHFPSDIKAGKALGECFHRIGY